jgi:acetyl-CoA carboxylase carboxyl transferase subunit alpha
VTDLTPATQPAAPPPPPVKSSPPALRTYLDFEKPIAELESKVNELKAMASSGAAVSITDEIKKLEQKAKSALVDTYNKLTPWQKAQVARHPERPHSLDVIAGLIEDFTQLSGDRYFAEDAAIVGGIGRFRGRSVMVIGHEKGSDTEGRIKHNFGMAMPEGYRKAGHNAHRHGRRLSRNRCRRAGPGRSDCPLDRLLPEPWCADRVCHPG